MASEFYEAYRNRHRLAEGWKHEDEKIIGYFRNYTPEEIIHAAGIIPVRIRGSAANITTRLDYLSKFRDSLVESGPGQAKRSHH